MIIDDFIQQHAPDGNLTALQAAQLLELSEEGDTGAANAEPETGGAPDAAPVVAPQAAVAPTDTNEPELNADNAVILAKDGKHTISYDKLTEAREGEKHWKAQAATAAQELEALKAQAQQRADAGIAPTATDTQVAAAEAAIEAGHNPELFGDFSEEAIAKGVQALVDQRVAAAIAQVDAKFAKAYEPVQQRQADDIRKAHFEAIYAKHPDADSIVESKELADWIAAQPTFARAGYEAVMQNGTAAEAIEFFDTFKAASGKGQAAPTLDVKAAAQAAIAKAKPAVPASLSDIPGGTAGPASRDEALAQMNPLDMSETMQGMSPAQIEEFLNRSL